MSLPSSGPISMSMIMTEMSQSALTPFSMYSWAQGKSDINFSPTTYHTPINVLSSGSIFSELNPLGNKVSMSWYGYNHTSYTDMSTTGTLYLHSSVCHSTSMLIMDVGTTNQTLSLNLSGSTGITSVVNVYYGKPWTNNGSLTGIGTLISSSGNLTGGDIIWNFSYNYVYNALSGSKIYFVVDNYNCPA